MTSITLNGPGAGLVPDFEQECGESEVLSWWQCAAADGTHNTETQRKETQCPLTTRPPEEPSILVPNTTHIQVSV